MPFDDADLAKIVLNSVPVSWLNQYNMTHQTLPSRTRTLLQDLESIEGVMDEKHEAGLKAKAKESSASAIAKGSSKKRFASRPKAGQAQQVLPALQGEGRASLDSQHQGMSQVRWEWQSRGCGRA